MIITHFGTTYPAGSPLFGTIQAVDDWSTTRPAVVQQASGASGVFDFFTNAGYPVAPIVAGKRFTVTAATYAGIETELDTLRAATIAAIEGHSYRIWGLPRGGNPLAVNDFRWAWAKCMSFKPQESYSEANYLKMPVELTFYCPEGIWYGQQHNIQYNTSGAKTITNAGNFPALLYVSVTTSSGSYTKFKTENTSPFITVPVWEYSDAGGFDTLYVTPTKYEVLAYLAAAPAANPYDNLSLGTSQVAWMWLDPGNNSVTFTTTGAGVLNQITVEYNDTYLL